MFAAGLSVAEYFSRWCDFWPFAAIAVFNLLIGNLFFLTMMVVATWKEKQRDLLLYAFFLTDILDTHEYRRMEGNPAAYL